MGAFVPGLMTKSEAGGSQMSRRQITWMELDVREEGTWMNVDVAPDGAGVIFDLLGDIYRIPITGGVAEPLLSGHWPTSYGRSLRIVLVPTIYVKDLQDQQRRCN